MSYKPIRRCIARLPTRRRWRVGFSRHLFPPDRIPKSIYQLAHAPSSGSLQALLSDCADLAETLNSAAARPGKVKDNSGEAFACDATVRSFTLGCSPPSKLPFPDGAP